MKGFFDTAIAPNGFTAVDFTRFVLLMALMALAVVYDIKYRKIKNLHTGFISLAGILLGFAAGGTKAWISVLVPVLIPLVLLFPLYVLKVLGAGDIKLFCAVGAVAGFPFVLDCIMLSFIAGGVIAIFIMLFTGSFKKRAAYFFQYLKHCFLTRSIHPYFTPLGDAACPGTGLARSCGRPDYGARFPFSISAAAGALLAAVIPAIIPAIK